MCNKGWEEVSFTSFQSLFSYRLYCSMAQYAASYDLERSSLATESPDCTVRARDGNLRWSK